MDTAHAQNVFIGTTLRGEMSQSHLESLVPNSQVIINPPSVLRNLEDPGYGTRQPSTQWRNELFLQPGDWIPWVAATVVTTVLLLGGVVLMLGEKEKVNSTKSSLTLSEKMSVRDVEHCIASTSRLCSHMYHSTHHGGKGLALGIGGRQSPYPGSRAVRSCPEIGVNASRTRQSTDRTM